MVMLSPFVYWAQTDVGISLKIDLKNVPVSSLKIDLTNVCVADIKGVANNIKFSAQGVGAQGDNKYEFSLDLYSHVKTNEDGIDNPTIVRVFDNRVDILLQKEKPSWWPRLTAQPQKPAWLKINFDLLKLEDGQDSEEEKRDIMKDYPGMYDELYKEEFGYKKEDFRKVYLAGYNLFQFVGFLYVLTVMLVRYIKLESDSIPSTYEHVGSAMKFLQLLQYLEVMHPMFGYTKGGAMMPFLQVTGRNFVLFAMIEAEPRMQGKPVVFILFFVWALIEIVRYPFYISQLYKKENYLLTWLRYSMWLPLYPLGVICEAIIILRNIPYFEETQRFSVPLPNAWNFAFHMPTVMRMYLLLIIFPGLFFLMKHMHKLRNMKLRPKAQIKKIR